MALTRTAAAFKSRVPAVAFALAASTWLILILVSPYLVSHNAASSGRFRMAGLVYLAGHLVCHQRPDRSFHAWGVQFPVCGRCLGLYAGAAVGSLFAAWRPRRHARGKDEGAASLRTWRMRLTMAVVPTVASLGLEMTRVWAQSPAVRGVAALPLGFAVGWFVAAHADEVVRRVRTAWRV